VATQVNMEIKILSEISQIQKDKYHMIEPGTIAHICNFSLGEADTGRSQI
jgi:hypothetical protein